MATPMRLCVFCRRIEPISVPCNAKESSSLPKVVSPLYPHEEAMLLSLQQQPSALCQRCSDYDIVRVFRDAEAMDGRALPDPERHSREDNLRYHEMMGEYYELADKYKMDLGQMSSLVLAPSCPLCRLIFRILPREGISPSTDNLKIAPFRSYLQHTGWEKLVDEYHSKGAIFLGLDHTANLLGYMMGSRMGSDNGIKQSQMAGESICLATSDTFPGRSMGNGQPVTPLIDFSFPKQALENCRKHHGTFCEIQKPPEIKRIRVIDTSHRTVIPYPDNCDYLALSYVWGGVMPADGALESGTLPRTIEDAITVTKNLGYRYLWVDALCIDQTQDPTPQQRAEKDQQLRMMDMIYSSATLTLIALAGTDSNVGLPGVTTRRPAALTETIAALTLLTLPPTLAAEQAASTWSTRAWTLQEELLSRRHLFFTPTHLEFQCSRTRVPESLDAATHPAGGWTSPLPEILDLLVPGAYQPSSTLQESGSGLLLSDVYWLITADYTSRAMTNDGDSLNALLGVLNVWERTLLPPGTCVWGLPLKAHPPCLGWMHPRGVGAKPRRRAAFPSWSWTGWAGEVSIDVGLLPAGDGEEGETGVVGRDMAVEVVGVEGKELVVEGWVVEGGLVVRTEPFSEVVVPGGEGEVMGLVTERNFLHPNTLGTGRYEVLVVERVKTRVREGGPVVEKVFMVVLDGDGVGRPAERRTTITLKTEAGYGFECLGVVKRRVRLV
ncbi:heterokaryon incompatibility protein-domain-containing protein [Podospora conica]|nr:heterokaryon incompatibility protein-domain-containing protein [Schizothecium conicum]